MGKKIIIGLILICILSVSINIFQLYKMKQYKTQEEFYTEMFQNDFNNLIKSFDFIDGTGSLSNESAIKNSVSIVEELKLSRGLSIYKQSISLSEMLLYLSMFFVLESNEYINKNIDQIKPQLYSVSKNLNDEITIKEFNQVLKKFVLTK